MVVFAQPVILVRMVQTHSGRQVELSGEKVLVR